MNTHLQKTSLFLFALLSLGHGFSQTYLLQEDFEGSFPPTGWNINTPAGNFADGWTYGPQSGLLSDICVPQGNRTMTSQWVTYYPNNTWAFTPGLTLSAGTTYTLSFKQGNGNVWAKAVSVVDPSKKDSLQITIINQTVPATDIVVTTQGGVPAEITAPNGTLTLVANITPANASQAVLWEIVPLTGNASINSVGTVTPISNGTVWAKAKAASNTALQDSLLVTINRPNSSGLLTEQGSTFQVYPNPVRDVLVLHNENTHAACILTLMDVTGKTVLQHNFLANQLQTAFAMDLSSLKSGVYVLQIIGSHIPYTQKIMKE